MEEQRGRWIKNAPAGIIIILMGMCIPALTFLQTTNEQCPDGDYWNNGICCNYCHPGFKLLEKCQASGQRTNCTPCPLGQYSDQMNYNENCFACRECKEKNNEIVVSECKRNQNTICKCKQGYYKFKIDSDTYECRKCATCGLNKKTTQACTPEQNTVCECKEGYYKAKSKCEQCKNCTTECSHLCLATTTKTGPPKVREPYLIYITAGVAVLLMVLGVVITYKTTKSLTKKKLHKLSSEPTSVSVDSTKQVLINVKEASDTQSLTAVPINMQSEPESYNLPDCVPLEIKIPELIYTVLDLVPVLQVKRLVRTLGVKETEIEQAEMDHRSCREAHYQMLRVWAERGSLGGRGAMLHQPLFEELLDKLRDMHLGRAAEELETKFSCL